MPVENAFAVEVLDRLAQSSEASSRRMFGGVGIFHAGLMFTLIADNERYLKTDKQSRHLFEQADCPAFSYSKSDGKVFKMSYYLAPESFFEDADQTELWSKRAQETALRAPRKPNKTHSKK